MIKETITVIPKEDIEIKFLNEKDFHKLNKGKTYEAKLDRLQDGIPLAYYVTEDDFDFEVADCTVDGEIIIYDDYELVL